MSKYRTKLPQLSGGLFLTDAGLETTLIFHQGVDLPHFASFDLIKTEDGRKRICDYYESFIRMAKDAGVGFVLEGFTWRANPDWAARLGYSRVELADANRQATALLDELRRKHETPQTPIVLSANIGPRGDGYKVDNAMTAAQAEAYHGEQVRVFRDTQADMVSAFTLNYTNEAIGVVRACQKAGMPVVISFTVETDGKLPSGQSLKGAIEQVDRETGNGPAYYMLNCAHPTHFASVLNDGEPWIERLRGIRANASTRSHAELDVAPDLDSGDPADLGRRYRDLRSRFRHFNVLGGCCGTDHRHVEAICTACTEVAA